MIDWVWLVLRAASLILLLQAAGALIFLGMFGARLRAAAPIIRRTALRVALAAIAVLGVQWAFEPAHLAGEIGGLTDSGLEHILLSSATGATLAARLAGLGCVVLALLCPGAGARISATAAAALLGGSFLVSGHSVTSTHRVLLGLLLIIHLLTVAFWFGSLWPLRQLTRLEPGAVAAAVLAAFSAVAVWLVPLIALAGVAMAALLLPDLAALWHPYGFLLGTKVLLFALLMGIAALNKLRLVPAMARGLPDAATQLRFSLLLEFALICVVVTVTALMTGFYSPQPA